MIVTSRLVENGGAGHVRESKVAVTTAPVVYEKQELDRPCRSTGLARAGRGAADDEELMGDAPPSHRPPTRQDADGAPDAPCRPPLEQYWGPPPPPRSQDTEKVREDGSGDGSRGEKEGCLRWALDLHHLLEDQEGLQLFEAFLTQEGAHDGSLSFWFACNGLRSCEDPLIKAQYMKSIYRHYIRNNLVEVTAAVKAEMTEMKTEAFDRAQREYEAFLRRTTYPRFLQSDLYIERVQRMHATGTADSRSAECSPLLSEGDSPPAPTSGSGVPGSGVLQALEILPTVREEGEDSPPTPASLTKRNVRRMYRCSDILPRLARPAYESPGVRSGNPVPNPYHVRNSYFVPPSAQDSELHSLSSGAYTDEASTDVDSAPPFKEKLSHRSSQNAAIRKSAAVNRESHGEHAIIPRTQLEHPYSLAEKNPPQFAAAIIEKLRVVKKQTDAGEKMERFHRSQMEDFPGSRPLPPLAGCGAPQAAVAASTEPSSALCDRLLAVDEQSSQSILDDHVSRVFDSPLAKTPPRSSSPKRRGASGVPMSPYAVMGHHLRHRRDRDTCSSDSGAVRDYSPEGEAIRGGLCGRQSGLQQSSGIPCQRPRGPQLSDSGVDSGTSVVYEPLPCTAVAHDRVENWILSNKVPGMYLHPLDAERESSSRSHKKSTTSGNSSRSKQNAPGVVRRRVSSSTQGPQGGTQWGSACQGMSEGALPGPPRLPDTMSQLVEARRRLEVTCPPAQVQQQSLPKAKKWSKGRPTTGVQQTAQTAAGDVTVIGYCFVGETVPYRRKVPGKDITLRQFKAVLGRKGNYRYFFKRSCQEFGTEDVNEEISDDNEVLPLWDGKIFATVQPVD